MILVFGVDWRIVSGADGILKLVCFFPCPNEYALAS